MIANAGFTVTPFVWGYVKTNVGVDAYIQMKVFPGYATCAEQPDAWHQYAGSKDEYAVTTAMTFARPSRGGMNSAFAEVPARRLAIDPNPLIFPFATTSGTTSVSAGTSPFCTGRIDRVRGT